MKKNYCNNIYFYIVLKKSCSSKISSNEHIWLNKEVLEIIWQGCVTTSDKNNSNKSLTQNIILEYPHHNLK